MDVLNAAKRLIAARGPQGLTIDDLVRATGLSRTTLYRRTGGREALLDALQEAGLPIGDRTAARERILKSARAAFSRAGFDGATLEEIATAANVGLVTIYRHFGDKEGLAVAVLEGLAPHRAVRESRITSDLRKDLLALAERMLTGLRDDTPLVRWMMMETLADGPFVSRVRTLSPTRTLPSLVRLFSAHLGDGNLPKADPQLLAQSFVGMVMAFGVFGPLFNKLPAPDPAATARAVTDLFLYGALAPKENA
jgi:AcrR family transcriptional regulator